MTVAGKRIMILGIGEAGRSAARWLHGQGAQIACCDSLHPSKWPVEFCEWCDQEGIRTLDEDALYGESFSDCDLAVVSPGVPPRGKAVRYFVDENVPVIGELALAVSFCDGRLIGITGTNGKTTTTSLTAHILSCGQIPNVKAGNISPPLFDLLDKDSKDTVAVLEISSFQLEYFPTVWPEWLRRPQFSAAVFLNLMPDHLDRHKSVEEYGRCKARLFDFQSGADLAILGPGLKGLVGKIRAKVFSICPERGNRIGGYWNQRKDRLVMRFSDGHLEDYDLSSWKLKGEHNIHNLIAAAASARWVGASSEAVQEGLETFDPPRFRFEHTSTHDGLIFINDSKATNVAALIAALKALEGKVTLIAGGRGKGEDFSRLAEYLKGGNGTKKGARLENAILIGEEAHRLRNALEPLVRQCLIVTGKDGRETLRQAVELARSISEAGSTVLLSPACASFDMFSSYEERGMVFDRIVKGLK